MDPNTLRALFPIFERQVRGQSIAYLDNAATTHKPRCVLEAIQRHYAEHNANVHRAAHLLSQEASLAYDAARKTAAGFLNAASPSEIVFVRGATEGINLVAYSFLRARLAPGDEILLTLTEHHSNIVPWQLLAQQTGACLQVVGVDAQGDLLWEDFEQKLSQKTRLFALVHVSNAIGVRHPVKKLIARAHAQGVPVLLDACQSVPHGPVDVQDLDADFLVFSGHKVFGPTGIGVLYAKKAHLDAMLPYQSGGGMVEHVTFEHTRFRPAPERFEAGTPNICGAIALAEALRFYKQIATPAAFAHEEALIQALLEGLRSLPGLRIIGNPRERVGLVSFCLEGIHAHDVDTLLDHQSAVAIRSGHHCAQPLMRHFGLTSSVRASVSFYNTLEDIHRLLEGLLKVRMRLG